MYNTGLKTADKKVDMNKAASCIIMGMAVHLIGDTFAHRTMVPKSLIGVNSLFSNASAVNNRFYKGHFQNWSDFDARKQAWVIETRDIDMYVPRNSEGEKTVNTKKYYEDNISSPGFLDERYTYSKNNIKNMLELFKIDGTAGKAFDVVKIYNQSGVKLYLNNLNAYAHHAGYTSFNSSYSSTVFRVDLYNNQYYENEADAPYYERYVYGQGNVAAEK